ncbi:MAG: phosphate/phosphite/phosphonate ABC transporter substrate-binding protein [Magnetospiraceae bacterium]
MTLKKAVLGIASFIVLVLVVVVAIPETPVSGRPESAPMRVSVLPDIEPSEITARFSPLLDHLSRETGLPMQMVAAENYQDILRLFAAQEIDLAFFGGLTFVIANKNFGAEPLVMRDIDTRFTSYFLVSAEGHLRHCQNLRCPDLAGKVFSFGSQLSTSGHLMPRHFLKSDLQIIPEDYFGTVRHAKTHDQTALDVLAGRADVGVVNGEIYRRIVAEGQIKDGALRIIWETPPYPDYVWAVQEGLSTAEKIRLRDAFLKLDQIREPDATMLDNLGAGAFLPAGIEEYLPLRRIAESLDLMAGAP